MSAIKCGKCGHENDLTRVFCQNCGTRLERTEEAPVGPTITPVPVKRKSKPQGPSVFTMLGQFVKGLVFLLFLAALIALFVQMGRSPDGLPAPAPADDAAAIGLFDGVKVFASSPYRRMLDLKQEQINNYLASRLTASAEAGPAQGAKFSRAFVVLGEGTFQFYVERRYFGISVYFHVDCEPLAGPEGATALVKKGAIGRVPLHPFVLRLMHARVIRPAVEALAEPLDVLRKANQVTIQPGLARLGWPGEPARR
jgi:hypothetical protein